MSTFVRKYPAISLLVLAMLLGVSPLLAVNAGWLPKGWSQLGALSAGLAGIILAAVEGRKGGLRELLGRFLIWRVGIQWWAFALLFPILPSVVALYLFHWLGGPAVDWSVLKPLYTVIPTMIFLIIMAGIGEEFGWRGFALPRLQARHSALVSGLIVGVIWATWHVPLFFTQGTMQYQMRMEAGPILPILGYAAFVIAGSIQQTWLFNNTKGSVLPAAVAHGAGNAWVGSYIDVYRGHFGSVLIFMALSVVISTVIVLLAGARHLSRTSERDTLQLVDANKDSAGKAHLGSGQLSDVT
jgi:membrane protease YdiL (CAAX protease family)